LADPHKIGKEDSRIRAANGLAAFVLWHRFPICLEEYVITDGRNWPSRAKNATNVYQYREVLPNFRNGGVRTQRETVLNLGHLDLEFVSDFEFGVLT
jgi:hypothetical protein